MPMARARAPTLAVLLREARRQSRRPATHILRLTMAAIVLGGVALVTLILQIEEVDAAKWAEIARVGFITTVMLAIGVTALLAPLLVAMGVVEEKDEGTLDLLAITRLKAWQILLGKSTVRLMVLGTVLVGVVPALAVLLGYGGVAPAELGAAVGHLAVLACLLAIVAGFLAIEARNVVLPYLVTGVWAFGALLIAPVLYVEWLWAPGLAPLQAGLSPKLVQMAEYSPVFAAFVGTRWSPLGAAAWAPSALVLAALSPAAFRVATARLGEAGRRSRDERIVAAFQISTWLLVIATMAATGWFVWTTPPRGWWGSWTPQVAPDPWVAWGYVTGIQTTGTLLAVRLSTAVIAASSGRAGAAWSILPTVRFGGLRRWLPFRKPRGNPIAWRELATRAHGGAGPAALLVVLVWVAFVGWIAYNTSLMRDEPWAFTVLTALGASLACTVVLATASAVEERTADQLDLLLLTTIPRWRILSGKLVAVLVRSCWPIVIVLAVHAFLRIWWGPVLPYEPTEVHGDYTHNPYGAYSHYITMQAGHAHSWYGENPFFGSPLLRMGSMAAWFVLVLVLAALCALAVGLKVRAPRVAWTINLLGLVVVPGAMLSLAMGALIVHAVVKKTLKMTLLPDEALPFTLVFPFISDGWLECDYGTPWEVLITVAVLFVTDAVLFVGLAVWLRRWGARWFAGG